jgi:hypothetical protein
VGALEALDFSNQATITNHFALSGKFRDGHATITKDHWASNSLVSSEVFGAFEVLGDGQYNLLLYESPSHSLRSGGHSNTQKPWLTVEYSCSLN